MLRTLARLNFALRLNDGRSAPRPRGSSSVVGGNGEAARVLLVGNGIATGWGVVSHQLALTGALARALSAGSGLGVAVDHVGDETMNLAAAPAWIGDRPLGGYSAAVVVVGMNDAMRLTSDRAWQADWQRLLAVLDGGLPAGAPVVMAGVQPVRSVAPFDSVMGAIAQRRAHRLNEASRRIATARPRVRWVPMPAPAPDPDRPLGSPAAYEAWAAPLATALVGDLRPTRDLLQADAAPVPPTAPVEVPVAMQTLTSTPRQRELLDALTAAARTRLRVDAAMITFLDERSQHVASSTTFAPSSVPRGLTYCDATVRQDAPLVVPDRRADPRFADNPYLELTHLPFYAGVPVHDADGTAIGTFCVFSARPRGRDHVDVEQLQGYAREVEAQLRRATERDLPASVITGAAAPRV